MRFIYRCEECNIVIYKRSYYKTDKCPYCKAILKVIPLDQNAKLIEFLKSTDNYSNELDLFKGHIYELSEKELKTLFISINHLYEQVSSIRQQLRGLI